MEPEGAVGEHPRDHLRTLVAQVLAPVEQYRQTPQAGMNEQTTWSPAATRVTPSPAASTTPAPSCPPTSGSRPAASPVRRCSSEWHMPDASNLMRTSPRRGSSSSSCVSSHGLPGSRMIAAFVRMKAQAALLSRKNVNDIVRNMDTAATLERGRPATPAELAWRADWIRLNTVRLIEAAGLGHYTSTFSCAEIFATLYYHTLRLRPGEPGWPDRDRFLLGKGHVATGLWPVLADLGYYPSDWLARFGKVGSPLNDHPNMRLAPGIDFSSGALGHNLSVAAGIALAGRLSHRDYRTFVLTGDGELQEGQVWEAAMAASHYQLGNLVAIVDANGFSGSGPTSQAMNIEPLATRFGAFGWLVQEIDGHDVAALTATFDGLPSTGGSQPVCVIARTRKGHGASLLEQRPQAWHLGLLPPAQQAEVIAEISGRMG
ncbi:MAG TPA: transketolase [Streptosporangiaceae bacterium]